tara:strand:- start:3956 stop:4513 length:558 start_codon:yes stop_codon:yes gene_type:complete
MDLKTILDKEITDNINAETKESDENMEGMVRAHKKPVQLRDIENRSTNTTRESNLDTDEAIKDFLKEEKMNSLKRPWNKLDQGMKINRLKLFCEKQKIENSLSESEEGILSKMLLLACHSNKINRNTDVQYDTETCEIISIKPLQFDESKRKYKIHQATNGSKKNDKPKSKSQIDRFLKKSNSKK